MRSLNLDQLRTLIEVIELGSFTAAARQLNLSQPAISLQVRELEQRVGVRLVERVGRTLRATAAGRMLAERGRGILADCEATIAALRGFQSGSTDRVRIAATSTALTCLLPPIVRRLRAQHPGIDLLVSNMPSGATVEQVARNLVDLGLVTLPVEDQRLRVTPLRSLTLVAVLPSGTPDIPDAVTPDYAARQTLVLGPARGTVNGLMLRWLAGRLPLPQPAMHVDTVDAMWQVAALGLGVAVVPMITAPAPTLDVVVRPLDPPVPYTLALAEHRDKPDAPALRIVREALLALRTTATEPDDGAVGPPRRQPRPPRSAAKTSATPPRRRAPMAAGGARLTL